VGDAHTADALHQQNYEQDCPDATQQQSDQAEEPERALGKPGEEVTPEQVHRRAQVGSRPVKANAHVSRMLLGRQLHDLESFALHQSWEEAEEVSVDRGLEQRIATQRRDSAAQVVKPVPRDRAGERVKEPAPGPVREWLPAPHSCRERSIGALMYSLDETGEVL